MLRALLAVLRAPARAVPSRALVRQGAAGSHRCWIPAAATWEEVSPGRCGCSVVNSFKLFRKLLKPVSASQLARSIDERHQRLAAATVAARSRTDRSQGARRSPVDRLVHRLCASLGLSLLCRSRVLGAVLQQLCSAAGLAQWPKQQDGNEGCGRAAGSSNAPPVPSLSHPLTVSTPAALFISSASPVCSEPLLTHSIPNIQSLSPTTLRLIHRRYCKHSADDEDRCSTCATTPATPLPLVISVPSDTPPRSPTTLAKSPRAVVVVPGGDQTASEVADLSV